MNIVICGAGEVGRHAAEVLGAGGNSITIIDLDQARLDRLGDVLDAQLLVGNGAHGDVLIEAGCTSADLFLAATDKDEVNLLSASIAKGVGAQRCVARVHHSAFFEKRGLELDRYLGIDHLVCPEFSTAVAIAQTLRSPGAMAVERFADGKIEMQALPVDKHAQAVGKTLADLALPGSTKVATLERNGDAIIPGRETVVQARDVITLVGATGTFEESRRVFHGRQRVMIVGGSSLSVWLCRALHTPRFSVRLFEPDKQRAEELAAKLEWVTVLSGDPIEQDLLKEEHIDQVDAFVAATTTDEPNILAAARAKSMGAKLVVAVLQRGTYLHLLEHVGVDHAFSPRVTAVNDISYMVDNSPVKKLATLAEDVADVYELTVTADAEDLIDTPLYQLKLPERTLVVAIQRARKVTFPSAADTITTGDVVVVIAPPGNRKALTRRFTGK